MIEIKINDKRIQVPEGSTLLEAANKAGVIIPTMCHRQGFDNHPSCMVCVVKEKGTGDLLPACAYPAFNGMEIITDDDEVHRARKEALELLLSDHVGDCEAPCRIACPAGMNIPLMNRLIGEENFDEAIKIIKSDIALPLVLGYICPAPCEKACRRAQVNRPISICLLKRFVAEKDIESEKCWIPNIPQSSGKKVAMIGAGPAGLASAFHLTILGHQCHVFDKNQKAGGSLLQIKEDKLPLGILEKEINILKEMGIQFNLGETVDQGKFDEILDSYDAVVIATGNENNEKFESVLKKLNLANINITGKNYKTALPKVFACGSVVKKQKMAVKTLNQGKEAAHCAHFYLSGKKYCTPEKPFNSKFGKLMPEEIEEYLKEAGEKNQSREEVDFMEGFTDKQATIEAKLCMHCDCRKPDSCKLRIYAKEYHADRRKYWPEERLKLKKYVQHGLVIYEPEKCIRCGLCIEIAKKREDLVGLTFIGRGFDVRVQVPFSESLQVALEETAIECAEACPTGAIAMK